MSRHLFQSVLESLDQMETLRANVYLEIQMIQIECERNASLQECREQHTSELGDDDVQFATSTGIKLDGHTFDVPQWPILQPATRAMQQIESHHGLDLRRPQLEPQTDGTSGDTAQHAKLGMKLDSQDRTPERPPERPTFRPNERPTGRADENPGVTAQHANLGLPMESQELPHLRLDDSKPVEGDECNEEKGCIEITGTNSLRLTTSTQITEVDPGTPERPKMRRSRARSFESNELLWPVWMEDCAIKTATSSGTGNGISRSRSEARKSHRAGDEIRGGNRMHNVCVMRPSAPRRAMWDMLSILALGYDVFFIPLFVFELPQTFFMRFMDLATLSFWTVDVVLSFFTAFHENGVLEMRVVKIARRYLRTWFTTDISILMVDYALLALEDGSFDFLSFARLGKAMRILRVLRMFRLLRLLKASNLFAELSDFIFSEATMIIFRVLRLLFAIVLVNHILACGWYAVGRITFGHDANTWVKKLLEIDNAENSFSWFYTSSLHWSITQFTPASMEIVPCNFIERCYALCVILFALVSFSSFVSSITTSMTHFRTINMERSRQHEILRQFITQNRMSVDLGNRIQIFVRQSRRNGSQSKRIHRTDIALFDKLPETLRIELHGEVFEPILVGHVFFFYFHEFEEAGFLNICHTAMSEQSLSYGQSLFIIGEACDKMFFILSGRLDYLYQLDADPSCQRSADDYVCEMGMWLKWEHQGRLVAVENCEAVGLDSKVFRTVACRTQAFDACKKYAMLYVRDLLTNANVPGEIFDVSPEMALLAFEKEVAERDKKRKNQKFWRKYSSHSTDSIERILPANFFRLPSM